MELDNPIIMAIAATKQMLFVNEMSAKGVESYSSPYVMTEWEETQIRQLQEFYAEQQHV